MCGIKESIICGISPRNMMTVRLTRPENSVDHNTIQEYPRGLSKIKTLHTQILLQFMNYFRSQPVVLSNQCNYKREQLTLAAWQINKYFIAKRWKLFFNSLFFIVLVLSSFDKAVVIKYIHSNFLLGTGENPKSGLNRAS